MDIFTKTEQSAMEILVSGIGKKLYGLSIVELSNGALKRGSVYITLSRLEERGFLKSQVEDAPVGTIQRRVYKVTGTGQRSFGAWCAGQVAQQQAFNNWPHNGVASHG
jgi:DNA-binding PadR family transcriptional regulator